MDAEATRAVSAAPSLEVCECCGASDCDGECDTLRPKQQLPLPEVSFLDGKEMSAESLLAAASEAASAAAACGGEARHLSEGEMESCLQKGAEAYLLSVRMEANALPRAVYCREEPSIRKSKRRPSGGKDIMTDSVLCLSGASNLAETTNEAKSSSGAGDSSCRAERNGESGGDRPPPTRKTRYLEQLLRLQTREAEHHPPSPLWAMEALEFFQRIRSWIESQRVKKDSPPPSVSTEDQRASSSVAERCREWKGLDWQIYCRLFPPSLPLLLRCDARSADALLTQLLEDLDTQLKLHAQLLASSNKAKRCASRRLPADAGEAEAEGKAEREQDRQSKGADADESERTAKAAAQDGSTSALSLSSHKCCSVEGMPTSLPQLSWFFAALAVLDPVEALRADVAFSLQRLRRRFLKLRKLLLKRLGCTDDRHEKHLLEQRKQLDFFAAFEKSSPLSREKKKEEACAMESDVWLPQCVCRQLLAGTDTLLLIVRDFFGQK